MTIYVVYGPPAGGKTSYIAEHRKPNDVVIDQDALCVALGSPDTHSHPDHVKRIAGAARAMAIRKAADLGVDAWVIDTWLRTPSLQVIPDTRYLLVDPGQTVTLQRARRDGRPDEAIAAIHRWYLNPPAPPRSTTQAADDDEGAAADLGTGISDWW